MKITDEKKLKTLKDDDALNIILNAVENKGKVLLTNCYVTGIIDPISRIESIPSSNFSGSVMTVLFNGWDFSDSNMSNCRFSEDISLGIGGDSSYFEGCNLERVNFDRSILWYCHFKNANLKKSNLRYTNLTNGDLEGANLTDAELRGANICGAKIDYNALSLQQLIDLSYNIDNLQDKNFCNALSKMLINYPSLIELVPIEISTSEKFLQALPKLKKCKVDKKGKMVTCKDHCFRSTKAKINQDYSLLNNQQIIDLSYEISNLKDEKFRKNLSQLLENQSDFIYLIPTNTIISTEFVKILSKFENRFDLIIKKIHSLRNKNEKTEFFKNFLPIYKHPEKVALLMLDKDINLFEFLTKDLRKNITIIEKIKENENAVRHIPLDDIYFWIELRKQSFFKTSLLLFWRMLEWKRTLINVGSSLRFLDVELWENEELLNELAKKYPQEFAMALHESYIGLSHFLEIRKNLEINQQIKLCEEILSFMPKHETPIIILKELLEKINIKEEEHEKNLNTYLSTENNSESDLISTFGIHDNSNKNNQSNKNKIMDLLKKYDKELELENNTRIKK